MSQHLRCAACGVRATKRFFLKRALAKAQLNAKDFEAQMLDARARAEALEQLVKQYQAIMKGGK